MSSFIPHRFREPASLRGLSAAVQDFILDVAPTAKEFVPLVFATAASVEVKRRSGLLCVGSPILDDDDCYNPATTVADVVGDITNKAKSLTKTLSSILERNDEADVVKSPQWVVQARSDCAPSDIIFQSFGEGTSNSNPLCHGPSDMTKAFFGVTEPLVKTNDDVCDVADFHQYIHEHPTLGVSQPPTLASFSLLVPFLALFVSLVQVMFWFVKVSPFRVKLD